MVKHSYGGTPGFVYLIPFAYFTSMYLPPNFDPFLANASYKESGSENYI